MSKIYFEVGLVRMIDVLIRGTPAYDYVWNGMAHYCPAEDILIHKRGFATAPAPILNQGRKRYGELGVGRSLSHGWPRNGGGGGWSGVRRRSAVV